MKYKCGTTCPPVNGIPCIVICPPSSYSYDFSLPKDFNIKAPAPSIRSSSNWASAGHTTNNSNYTPSIPAPFISSLPKYAVSTNALENNSPKNTRLTSKPQFQSLLEKINNPQHGRLVPEKVINLSNNNLQNGDILLLVQKLQYQALNLDLLDFSKNQISFTGVENILYSFHFDAPNGRYIVTMNLSNNIIGDDGAEYIATSLKWGRYPHLKALDVSGNQITPAGHGYIAQALKAVNQTIAVTLVKSKEVSKAILKETMKGMLYIAKNNGITTNEMLTNDQTVEYCKKGGINVLKNIIWGGITCNTKLGRAVDLAELDMGTIMKDVVVQIANPLKKPYAFVCTTEEIIFSVRDEDFANCLIGVNNLLEE